MDRAEVITRLEEAGATLLMLPIPLGGWPADYRVQWPEMVWTFWEMLNTMTEAERIAWQRDRNRTVPMRILLPDRIARMDECLDWLLKIHDGRHRKVVSARMLVHPDSGRHVVSWRRLSRQFALHRDVLKGWHEAGIKNILTSAHSAH